MTKYSSRNLIGAVACAVMLAIGVGAAHAEDISTSGAIVSVTGTGGKVRAAGASVVVGGTASTVEAAGAKLDVGLTSTGDVKIAGAQVSFVGSAGGDLDLFGAAVNVKGTVAHDAHIGGAVVDLDITTGGSLQTGAATLTLSPNTDVAGNLEGGGAVVVIDGHVGGSVKVGGAVVTFNGRADGPVEITANRVVLGPHAVIGGDLIVRSTNPLEKADGAVVKGSTTQVEPPEWVPHITWVWWLALAVAIALGTLIAGIVLLLFGGRVFAAATEHVRHRPLSSFLLGILTIVLIPFIAVVLMVTVVGISVGFALLLLMPFLFVFGHAIAAAGIAAGLLLRRPGELGGFLSLVMLIVGAAILTALGFIPVAGPLIVAIALVLGVGAFARTLGSRLRRHDARIVPA